MHTQLLACAQTWGGGEVGQVFGGGAPSPGARRRVRLVRGEGRGVSD